MWDLIVSVPDHCLSFYFKHVMAIKSEKYPWLKVCPTNVFKCSNLHYLDRKNSQN